MGSQNSNLAITRRPDGLRNSRCQLSAYFCTLFLVRWVPGLKSFNLIDFMNLGVVRVGFGVGSGVVREWLQGGSGVVPGWFWSGSGVVPWWFQGGSGVVIPAVDRDSGNRS